MLVEGARTRDIYLPVGTWWEEDDPARVHAGPTWLRNHPAPLDYLPYFVRQSEPEPTPEPEPEPTPEPESEPTPEPELEPNAAVAPSIAAVLVLYGIVTNVIIAL